VPDQPMPTGLATGEAEPPTRHPGIRLEMGLEHRRKRRRLQDRAMLVGAAAYQRRRQTGNVADGGVDPATCGADPVPIGHRRHTVASERVAGRQTRCDPTGPDQVGVRHAERLEDPLPEVARQRHSAHVLDDLAERGEPVVAVREPRAGLGDHPQTTAVVLGQRRHRFASGHAQNRRTALERARFRMQQVPDPLNLRNPGGVRQQMAHGRRPETSPGRDQPVAA
jgi:hypothetical protein